MRITQKIFGAVLFALVSGQSAWAEWDQRPNHYHVTITNDGKRAHIKADVYVEGNELALFGVNTLPTLKNGQGEFLENIVVQDMAGKSVAFTDKGEAEYVVAEGDRRLTLTYEVRLDHAEYHWPAGVEEVLYHTNEGIMAVGNSLFLVPGVAMPGKTEVSFTLPPGWKANTPWVAGSRPGTFVAETRRQLVNNAMFLGTAHSERFMAGGVELTLVMGKRYWPQKALFMDLMRRQLASYQTLFGGPPRTNRYLVVINDGAFSDGGAFASSFSQIIKGEADASSRVIWGRIVAHELLHFWNGLTLVPAEPGDEWFKEGVTDYLTLVTLVRNQVMDRKFLISNLENLPRGQAVARNLMGLKSTVREAVNDKHGNWLLVYGGGTIAALAMDVELRKATRGKVGMPQLMQSVYAEFGQSGKRYTQVDIVRHGRKLAGINLQPTLERIVNSTSLVDMEPLFADIGLRLHQFGMLETHLLPNPNATPETRKRFADIFGIQL